LIPDQLKINCADQAAEISGDKMNIFSARVCMRFILTTGMFLSCSTHAALIDIANAPISLSSTEEVKPNVMFIIDDSGSMDWTYSPDAAENFSSTKFGSKSAHCNGMYFDERVTYKPPVNADGTNFPDASFSAAWVNGFKQSDGTVNLKDSVYYNYNQAHADKEPDLGFVYKADGSVDTNARFYTQCNTTAVANSSLFPKITLTAASPLALRTNFANWYSYYRKRILTMKSAAGLAFKTINNKYRIGFTTHSYTGTNSTNDSFLNVDDFEFTEDGNAHKSKWYEKLYKTGASGGTPLRSALSKVGRMYAGKLLTGANDPVQYSCQQNFAILATDGYWNGSAGYQMNGTTAIGNQDGAENRPMHDGTQITDVTTTTATITVSGSNSTSVTSVTVNGQTITSGSSNASSTSGTVASRLAAIISRLGYTAERAGNVVTVKAPASAGPITFTPVVTKSGNMTFTVTPFTSVTTPVTSGGVSDSLADVAAYYYNTDLRTTALGNCTGSKAGVDLCKNDVLGSGLDNKPSQHMTTFTLGLGVNGTLKYSEDYLSNTTGDFAAIKNGTKIWPDPMAQEGPERIDDLWHAAVNGRGTYFSAQTPDSLVSGIVKALTGAKVRDGSGATAATSNLEPVEADNFLFLATYRTVHWDGDLKAKIIDPNTGAISATENWSAQEKLDAKVSATSDTRTIYTYDSAANAGNNKLKSFTWSALTAGEKAYMNGICESTLPLSQCIDSAVSPNLSAAQRTNISGENLLNFIRGQSGKEDRGSNVAADRIYRERLHVLGDMIGSQPVYVKAPPFAYLDDGYEAFKAARKDRLAMVYVAANDGMLHAFEATVGQTTSGSEKWAYIPPMVMPNLYKLADRSYATNHQYYVDGTPTLGDVCPSAPTSSCNENEWKSILVGGLNSGGKGYYALDVTVPNSPKALWNFTATDDADIGMSYGNAVITKLPTGQWVAVFTSGYNNGGTGRGYVYVLNAYTGALIAKLDTGTGSADTPSGLAKLNAWIDNTTDNTAKRFYGGDMLGNLWRFEIDDTENGVGRRVTAIAELGNVSPIGLQPITIKPELAEITDAGVGHAVILVGTGRYLGVSDLNDARIQSIYAIKDELSATGLGKVRRPGVLVQQRLVAQNNGTRTTSTNPVNWASKSGWYLDLDLSVNENNEQLGERVNIEMQQQLGLLKVAGNVPKANACTPGGESWIYDLDFRTGQFIAGANNNAAGRRQDGLAAGLKTLKLTSGKTITLVTGTDGSITVLDDPTSNPGGGLGARRVSWRELIAD
jgi:type IV pilus assembly protein PilY1